MSLVSLTSIDGFGIELQLPEICLTFVPPSLFIRPIHNRVSKSLSQVDSEPLCLLVPDDREVPDF